MCTYAYTVYCIVSITCILKQYWNDQFRSSQISCDGTPNSALEAMAAKTPVISTNTGGLPEVNIHGKTGFLSNVGDVSDMSKNALKILINEETLNSFKEGAYIAAQKFSIGSILPNYEEVYRRIKTSCC